jgi:hypothetical protein
MVLGMNGIAHLDLHGLARILHEGSGFCSVAGNTVWSIVQTSIAIAMVFEGSAEM